MYLSYTQKTGNKEVGPLLENRPYIYIDQDVVQMPPFDGINWQP